MRPGAFRPLAFLLGTAVVAVCPALRPVLADETGDRIDQVFAAQGRPDVPGSAVAVLHRGEVIHQRVYGQAHLEWPAPIAPSTVFPVASVSKQFTALALALLAEQGKLSLDDDVRKYLPELPDSGVPSRYVTCSSTRAACATFGIWAVMPAGGLTTWSPTATSSTWPSASGR